MAGIGPIATPGGTTVELALKVAVAVGSARRFVVGDPQIQLIDVLAGALVDDLADAEHLGTSRARSCSIPRRSSPLATACRSSTGGSTSTPARAFGVVAGLDEVVPTARSSNQRSLDEGSSVLDPAGGSTSDARRTRRAPRRAASGLSPVPAVSNTSWAPSCSSTRRWSVGRPVAPGSSLARRPRSSG